MKMLRHIVVVAACVAMAACGQSAPAPEPEVQASAPMVVNPNAPQTIGDCVGTTVAVIGPRLEGAPDSGSTVIYANDLAQVDYDVVPGIVNSRVGDAVRVCLVSIPENCPRGDTRGRVYAATNLRSNDTWTAPDSQHSCGGA